MSGFVYQIWSHGGQCIQCKKEEPVIRDSRIYLNREDAVRSLQQFPDSYIVEYPLEK